MSFSFQNLMGADVFIRKYRARPYSSTRFSKYEYTGKIVLSEVDLAALTTMNLQTPYLFSITFGQYQTCVGVMEFTADPGSIYMPNWIYQKLCISGDCMVSVRSITIPTASSITLKANTYQLENCLQNAGALSRILRDYSVAMKGDFFKINFNNRNYILQIMNVKPSNICCIAEGDVTYEILPADDTPKTPVASSSNTSSSPFGFADDNGQEDEDTSYSQKQDSKPISKFSKSSFSWDSLGPGHRLDSKPSRINTSNNNNQLYTSNSNNNFSNKSSLFKKSVGIFEEEQKKSYFQGQGHKLSER